MNRYFIYIKDDIYQGRIYCNLNSETYPDGTIPAFDPFAYNVEISPEHYENFSEISEAEYDNLYKLTETARITRTEHLNELDKILAKAKPL